MPWKYLESTKIGWRVRHPCSQDTRISPRGRKYNASSALLPLEGRGGRDLWPRYPILIFPSLSLSHWYRFDSHVSRLMTNNQHLVYAFFSALFTFHFPLTCLISCRPLFLVFPIWYVCANSIIIVCDELSWHIKFCKKKSHAFSVGPNLNNVCVRVAHMESATVSQAYFALHKTLHKF
jgi:hypothetical protein